MDRAEQMREAAAKALKSATGFDEDHPAVGAIRALPAVTPAVKVKPLVWRDDGTNGHETDHAFGFYEVYPSPEGDMLSRDGVDSGVYSSIEAAKAAAQSDYEARIMSALDVMPAPTLAEAAKVLLAACDARSPNQQTMFQAADDNGIGFLAFSAALRRIAEGQA